MRNTGSIAAAVIVTITTLTVGYGLMVSGIIGKLIERIPLQF